MNGDSSTAPVWPPPAPGRPASPPGNEPSGSTSGSPQHESVSSPSSHTIASRPLRRKEDVLVICGTHFFRNASDCASSSACSSAGVTDPVAVQSLCPSSHSSGKMKLTLAAPLSLAGSPTSLIAHCPLSLTD